MLSPELKILQQRGQLSGRDLWHYCLLSTTSGNGQERHIHHIRPAVAHSGGEFAEGGITIEGARAESRVAGEARKVGTL